MCSAVFYLGTQSIWGKKQGEEVFEEFKFLPAIDPKSLPLSLASWSKKSVLLILEKNPLFLDIYIQKFPFDQKEHHGIYLYVSFKTQNCQEENKSHFYRKREDITNVTSGYLC